MPKIVSPATLNILKSPDTNTFDTPVSKLVAFIENVVALLISFIFF